MTKLPSERLPRPLYFVLTLTALLFAQFAVLAQTDSGRIVGMVVDPNGAIVPGATIVVKNERTGEERTLATSNEGYYVVTSLKPSTYTVMAKAPNFTPAKANNVQLAVGQELTLNLTLQTSGVAEIVTVEAAAEQAVDTSSARIGANVNQREVEGLPVNGRQLSQLYLQAPGSLNSGSGTFGDIRFSGRAVEQNIIRYDGIEGTAIIDASPGNLNGELASPFRLQSSLENIQEFRVESNNYPAEYGTGTGGQINVVTKSGSNNFHGSVFEYLRNERLDARNFFDLAKKSPLRLNQFGGSIGGPIVKNRSFFFFSYEGYRLRAGINSIEAIPSTAARAQAAATPVGQRVVPLIDAYRAANPVVLAGASTNPLFDIVQLQSNARVNENAVAFRFDHRINEKHSFYFRYFRDQGSNNQPEGVTGRRVLYRVVPQNGILAFQSTLSPTAINEFKLGFNGALSRVQGVAPTVNDLDLSAISINLTGSIANNGIAGQGASTGIALLGGQIRGSSAFNGRGFPYTPYSYSFIDNLSYARGNHNAKFGGEVRLIRMYTDRLGGTTYSYSSINNFITNTLQNVQFTDDLSSPSPFNNGAMGQRQAKQEYYIAYAQDEWKLRPNLTINYGLRYEYYTPLREARHLNVLFDINNGVLLPPDRAFFKSSKTNFGPRIALTYSPNYASTGFFGGGRTVLRAGFGIYNGPGQTEDQIQPIESDRIQTTVSGGSYSIADINTLRANFINNPNNRSYQPRAYAPEYQIPERVYQYSVSFQQELLSKLVATIAYVGSQGRNLFLRNFTNRIVSVRPDGTVIRQFDIVDATTGAVQRPFAEVDYKTSGGSDSYNALQTSLGRRFSSGLTLNSQYTFARSFGNTAGSNEALTSGNPFDFNYDRGYNLFDVRHTFNLSALYTLPMGKGKTYLSHLSGLGQALLGNIEIGGIINARSGLPLDLRVTRPDVVFVDAAGNVFSAAGPGRTAIINTPGGGSSRNVRRPDLVPGVNPYLDQDRTFLNPAAFAIPKPGTFGNLQRGLLRGPNFRQFDFIINKRFTLTETTNVEFRAEFFNIFNITNFANPPATLPNALGTGANQIQPGQPFTAAAAGSFGVLNQTVERTVGLGTNRQIQFALRLNF